MGSKPSSHVPILECPKDYDKTKFKKICSLFDKLDKDSNLGVSSDEIENIAELHVENCIKHTEGQMQAKAKAFEVAKMQILLDEKSEQAKLKQKFQMKRDHEKLVCNVALQSLEQRIEIYKSLDKQGKAEAFMKAVMPKGGEHMDFWSFFEYMKTRTEDIQNIEHNE